MAVETIKGCPQPCATCPWLKDNHGVRTAAKWYTKPNLKRLWNGLRTGAAPGMICHATDPASVFYGATKAVAPGHERECIGANTLLQREVRILERTPKFQDYRKSRPFGLTKRGLMMLIERTLMQNTPFGRPMPVGDVADQRIQIPEFIVNGAKR